MKNLMRTGAFLSLALALIAASDASAAGILGQVNVKAGAALDAKVVQATTSVNTNAGIDSSGGVSTPGPQNRTLNATSATSINSSMTASGTNASGTASAEVSTFTLTRDDIESDSGSVPTISDPLGVSSEGDLEMYARSVMLTDENVSKIESDSEKVSVWYKDPAKFIGLFPVTVEAKATVYADGTVSVDYPWWVSLFVTGESATDVKSSLESTAGTIARSESTASLSTNTQARLINALRAILEAQYNASLEASTSTDEANP